MMAGVSAAIPTAQAPRTPPPAPPPDDTSVPVFELCANAAAPAADAFTDDPSVSETADDTGTPESDPLAGLLSMLNLLPPPPAASSPPADAAPLAGIGSGPASTEPLVATTMSPAISATAAGDAVAGVVATVVPSLPEVPVAMPLPVTLSPPVADIAAPAPVLATPAATPPLSLQDPDFGGRVGERVMLSFDAGLSEASIELHPSELGPIHIRIENRGDRSHVMFEAAHPATRELLATTLPQLREMLSGQGVEMGRSQVGTLAERRGQDSRVTPEQGRDEPPPRRRQWRVGMIDHYA